MEAEGAVRIYQRSEEKRKLRYLPFVGDGDSKAYSSVQQAVPYGHAVYIEKEECIAHVTKRMGTNLRALVAKNKGTTLIHIMTKVLTVIPENIHTPRRKLQMDPPCLWTS